MNKLYATACLFLLIGFLAKNRPDFDLDAILGWGLVFGLFVWAC